jgi:hypothetical protein
MVELSWLNNSSLESGTIIYERPVFEGLISDSLEDRILYYEMFLRNNGEASALNLGFYIESIEGGFNFLECLRWGSLDPDPDGKPYGVFTVFGVDESDNSFIEKFKDNSITAEELIVFHHNYLQGTGIANKINLSASRVFLTGGTYGNVSGLESAGGTGTSIDGSKPGVLKVLVGVRMPNTVSPVRIRFNHKVFYEESA